MATDYIPTRNVDFNDWVSNFSTLLTATPTDFGLVSGDAVAVAATVADWNAAWAAANTPETRTSPTVAAMQTQRQATTAIIRPYAVSVSRNSAVTNENKTAIGVTVAKLVPTPIPPPTTVPALSLVSAIHLAVRLAYRDTSTPTSKAKPFGAIGIEIWQSVGTVPSVDPAQASYVGTWTKSPNALSYDSAQVGKAVTVWARWVTRGGAGGVAQVGPWSTALNFTVL